MTQSHVPSFAAGLLLVAAACSPSSSPAPSPVIPGAGGAGGVGGGGGGTATPLADHPALASEALREVIATLASDEHDGRDEGTAGSEAARAYIIGKMEACGIEPLVGDSYLQPITTGDGTNILGVVRGSDASLADRHVIVSAHYDHLGHCGGAICNGADDNAAGVALALGVGCALAEQPLARSVIIASWDAEEPPAFLTDAMGSQFYADNPVVPLEQTDAVLVLDLVGSDLWPGFGGHFILGAELSPQVASALREAPIPAGLSAYRSGLHLVEEQPLGHQPWSDYDAFRNAGRPVLFFSNGQNQRYHTPADEMDLISMPKVTLEGQYLAAIVENLAGASDTPTFVADGADYAQDAATGHVVLEAALAPGGLVDSLGLSETSRATLQDDLDAAIRIEATLQEGGALTPADVRALRDGTQHLMCFSGSTNGEAICNGF